MEDSVQFSMIVSLENQIKAYFRIYLCQNLSLSMFLGCSYFFTKSEADALINSVLRQNTACTDQLTDQPTEGLLSFANKKNMYSAAQKKVLGSIKSYFIAIDITF